jgi:thymidylate synthase
MSKADNIFINLCKDIIENGTSTEGQKVRPKWEDGTSAYTIKKFGFTAKYDLREEFPALTLRKTALKSAMDEILWIYQKKSNNIKDLNSHIWDEWADENGSIGNAYGYQVGKLYDHHKENGLWIAMDQMDAVLYDLKFNPFSRRIMINLWDPKDLSQMNLQPCCYNIIFNVTDEGHEKLTLNMTLNQRSSDTLTANNWNVAQYAILLMMVAQVSNMEAGVLMHCITDAHIYDKHIDLVKELIKRPTYNAPKVYLNPEITDFYKFTTKDLIVEDYQYGEQISIPVAI